MNCSPINKPAILLTFALAGLLFSAWQYKNAAILLFSGAWFFSILAITVKRYADYLLPVIVTFATLAVCEYVMPYFTDTEKIFTELKSHSANGKYTTFIDGFGYLPNPGVHTVHKFTHKGETIYNASYTIDADGYRKSPYSSVEADIYLYGGSYAFGEGLDDNATLAYFLWKNHNLAVKNMAFSGYGLQQALFNIQENGISSKQGVNILLTYPIHALRSACKSPWLQGSPKYTVDSGYVKLTGTCPKPALVSKILNKSNIFSLAKQVLFNPYRMNNKDIELYFAVIKTIRQETHKNNSKLIVAFQTVADEHFTNTDWTNESILQQLAAISDAVIDVTLRSGREAHDNIYHLHRLDTHPSAKANEVKAGLIAELITRTTQ